MTTNHGMEYTKYIVIWT